MSKENSDFRYQEYPKTCDKKDFWGQVSRTINGKPFSDENIQMIIQTIKNKLDFSPEDNLLDIGCGNGALANYFFEDCNKYLGVDLSEYLIEVAKEYFEKKPNYHFINMDAIKYLDYEKKPEKFNKVLCYGTFSYFSFENAELLLNTLNKRFTNVNLMFIGNLPDKELAHLFYSKDISYTKILDSRESSIGIWRSKNEFKQLANKSGWEVEFSIMDKNFCAAYYRYDALLKRKR